MDYPHAFSWSKLDALAQEILLERANLQKLIQEKPVTINAIDSLVSDGWRVHWSEFIEESNGSCVFGKFKIIELSTLSRGYLRDKIFFHDLVHAWYKEPLYDAPTFLNQELRTQNNAIAEWLGRKLRATPDILQHGISCFGLEPHIYDKASCAAFYDVDMERQQVFSFVKEYPLFMD